MKQKIVFEYDNDNINNLIYVDYNLLWDCLPKTMIAGIYFLWNEHKEILYIGKSTNCIRQRLASHLFKVNDNEKEIIINDYNNHKMYVIGAIIGLTVIGSTLYVNKKGVQYGGAFDTMTFIFG